MKRFSFGLSAILALAGIGMAVFGIETEAWKPVAIGLVLIFGAGVFATLFLGSRWASHKPLPNESPGLVDR